MDTSRLTPGDISAGVGGIVLLISLFLPWYGVSVNVAGFSASENASGWEVFSAIDIILFAIAVVAIALVALKALDQVPAETPVPLILLGLGALAVLLIIYRLIDSPAPSDLPDEVDVSRKIGIFIGLIGAAGIAYGGWRANMESPSAQPAPAATPPPPAV
ncbi:MAG TPA: hypothetical protein VF072_10335 [Thermoleophilaceae bacterium]